MIVFVNIIFHTDTNNDATPSIDSPVALVSEVEIVRLDAIFEERIQPQLTTIVSSGSNPRPLAHRRM